MINKNSEIRISSTYDEIMRVHRIRCEIDGDAFNCSIGHAAATTQHGIRGLCKAMFRHYGMDFVDALMDPDGVELESFQVIERVLSEVCAGAEVKRGELKKAIRQLGDEMIVEAFL